MSANKHSNISIIKASGQEVAFDESKLKFSLKKSGASDEVIGLILDIIKDLLYNGITTREIYKTAFRLLRKNSRSTAARYKLKKALVELGPTGFPFEIFISHLLRQEGFQTQVGIIVKGHCVNHEVDVVAEKENHRYMIECKFHNDLTTHSNVKVPLYIHSRFNDIEKEWLKKPENSLKFQQGWIYTNTRFTKDAIQYGNCSGLNLVSWDYPLEGSLKERIDKSGLHPITCLTTLTLAEKKLLTHREKVLSRELCKHPELLTAIGVSPRRQKNILKEAHELCNPK